jgi:hypothetical protein
MIFEDSDPAEQTELIIRVISSWSAANVCLCNGNHGIKLLHNDFIFNLIKNIFLNIYNKLLLSISKSSKDYESS